MLLKKPSTCRGTVYPRLVACLAALICVSGPNRGAPDLEVSFGCIPQAGVGK